MTENQEPLRILQGKKGTYEIIRPIGRGGFGYTFLAEDLTAVVEKRYCVVKQLRMDVYHDPKTIAGIKRSFKREARVLQNLGQRSGNIPSLDDYFSITVTDPVLHIPQEFNFLVQQYIEGEDLGEELKQQGLFSETKVLDLLKNILPVLKFIHNNNVIHRDIKPSNIIRSTEEENKFYLIDFGAVKQVIKGDIDTKETSIVFGDGNYAPPEQRSREQVNASSDLYLDGEPDWDTYKKLGDRVGWRQNGKWFKLYDSYIFSTNGPSGQLPALWVWGDAVDVVMVCIMCLYGLDYFFGFVLALLGMWFVGLEVALVWAVSVVVLMLVWFLWWVVGGLVGFACGWGGFGGLGVGVCGWGGWRRRRRIVSFLFSRL